MSAVPRIGVGTATLAIKVADLCASRTVARPVITRVVFAVIDSVAGQGGTRKDVVFVR